MAFLTIALEASIYPTRETLLQVHCVGKRETWQQGEGAFASVRLKLSLFLKMATVAPRVEEVETSNFVMPIIESSNKSIKGLYTIEKKITGNHTIDKTLLSKVINNIHN